MHSISLCSPSRLKTPQSLTEPPPAGTPALEMGAVLILGLIQIRYCHHLLVPAGRTWWTREMMFLEQEAAQPSLGREHNALGWVLGAQGPEEPAAGNCNKGLFPAVSCICMKEPPWTPISWWECRNNVPWGAAGGIVLFLRCFTWICIQCSKQRETLRQSFRY